MNSATRGITSNLLFRLLLGVVAFHAAVQAFTIGASLLAIPLSQPTAIGVLAISIVFGWFGWRWGGLSVKDHRVSPDVVEDNESASAGIWPWVVLAAAVFSYLVLLTASIIGRDSTCDGNTYHIPTIHWYLLQQRVCWIEEPFSTAQFMNGYPKAAELFAMICVQALHPALLNTANLLFLPLGILAVAYLARALGASSSLTILVGAAWVLLPVNVCQAGTTYVDSCYASCVAAYLAILFAVMRGWFGPGVPTWRSWLTPAVGLGSALGLVIGVKASGVVVGGLGILWMAMFFALTIVVRSRDVCWTRYLRKIACFFVVVIAIGTVVGGYWYIRNWLIKESPLYPAGVVVMGHRLFPGVPVKEVIREVENTPKKLQGKPTWRAIGETWLQVGSPGQRWFKNIVGVDARLGGLGYMWIVGCFPAMCWLLVCALTSRRLDAVPSIFLVGIIASAFFLQPMCWWARYTVWIFAVGLPCFAVAACRGLRRSVMPSAGNRFRHRLAGLWVASCCIILLTEGALSLSYATWNRLGLVKGHVLENPAEAFTKVWNGDWSSNCPFELQGMKDILNDETPIACGPLEALMKKRSKCELYGWLSYPIGQRHVYAVSRECDHTDILRLRSNAVRVVVWDDSIPVPETLRTASEHVEPVPGLIIFTLRSPSREQPSLGT